MTIHAVIVTLLILLIRVVTWPCTITTEIAWRQSVPLLWALGWIWAIALLLDATNR